MTLVKSKSEFSLYISQEKNREHHFVQETCRFYFKHLVTPLIYLGTPWGPELQVGNHCLIVFKREKS